MQAENRKAPFLAFILTTIGTLFWTAQALFAAAVAHSIAFTTIACLFAVLFAALFAFSLAAFREFRRIPPPVGHDLLPADYKIPYSHYHADPPEVRLAAELEQRRQRLSVQQKELELLEEKLKKKLEEGHSPEERQS